MAPPWGLYLAEVHYDPECFHNPSALQYADEMAGQDSGNDE